MSKPGRLNLAFNSFDEMLNYTDRLRAGQYEKLGNWDLAMILDHMVKGMNAPFSANPPKPMVWPAGALMRFIIHRMAKLKRFPSIRFRATKDMVPTQSVSLDAAFAAFAESIQKANAVTAETIHFPPIGVIPTEDYRRLQLLHGAHHLSFIRPIPNA